MYGEESGSRTATSPFSQRVVLLLASLAGLCWAGALAMLIWGGVIDSNHMMRRNAWYII